MTGWRKTASPLARTSGRAKIPEGVRFAAATLLFHPKSQLVGARSESARARIPSRQPPAMDHMTASVIGAEDPLDLGGGGDAFEAEADSVLAQCLHPRSDCRSVDLLHRGSVADERTNLVCHA